MPKSYTRKSSSNQTAGQPCRVAAGLLAVFIVASMGLQSSSLFIMSQKDTRSPHVIMRSAIATLQDNDTTTTSIDIDRQQLVVEYEQPVRYSKQQLKLLYTSHIETQVRFNNWDLGCNDLQNMSPYLKVIADRLASDKFERKLIIDVGANNGDDTLSILESFGPVRGMCWAMGVPMMLLSIEPSPKVFCELTQAMEKRQPLVIEKQQVHLLNIALSSQTGNRVFIDPGNEGGHFLGNNSSSHLGPISEEEWNNITQCQLPVDDFQNQSIDVERSTMVPTYTLDLLMDSLEALGKLATPETNTLKKHSIFILKIDTEGHDHEVLLGAKQLLHQKRVEFVIFETWNSALVHAAVKFMAPMGYECYLLAPRLLVPLHVEHHWYHHMDNFTELWWGNAICGISGSKAMRMLWGSYHSDDLQMINSYDILYSN
jgi:Methyltransferase FkbM domain